MTTIAMPNGMKYRISSVRRYIVVRYLTIECRWVAIKRSDNLQTALIAWRSAARQKAAAPTNVIDANADGGPAVIR